MKIRVEHLPEGGSKFIAGSHVRVIAIRDDGEEFDISNMVRAVDVRMHVGEIVTASMDVFVTEVETRAEIENLMVRDFRPRKLSLWKRLRDVTTFNHFGVREYVRR